MKGKLIAHYFFSFITACLVIVIINIYFMRNSIYNEGALYNYNPQNFIDSFSKYINYDNGNIAVVGDGNEILKNQNIGLQILDDKNKEVYSTNKPNIAPSFYTNVDIINLYTNETETVFLGEKNIDNKLYTYLLFFDPKLINRVTYNYNTELILKAHKFPILIGINIILLLVISFIYTLKIIKPINRLVDKILKLSMGNYNISKNINGVYYAVEEKLNELGEKLKNNEEERAALEEMREEWISNISHDIKTPLTSIIGNAEILSDMDYELEDSMREKCSMAIIKKGEYIKTLVDDLNLSTRLKSNNIVLNIQKVNIVSVIRHVIIDIINDEKFPHNNISFNYSKEEILVKADENLIKRVFINLIINSFIHNDLNVMVEVNIKELENERALIIIKDNGKGVSKYELKNIFKRYYRGTNTSKKIEGSGLGMAIAHDIIKVHKGEINIISEVDKGMEIRIIL